MCFILFLLFAQLHVGLACLGSQARQYAAPQYQYQAQQPAQYLYGQAAGAPRAAGASNLEGVLPIASNGAVSTAGDGSSAALGHSIFGQYVRLSEFSSNGYNAEGGGPVAQSSALRCDFEGRPCCWANVPTPDDQIDWQTASGVPDSPAFRNISIDDRYLVAYASNAAPSDEAQFASCSVGCSSSPIRIRTRHWQSSNVLLQVCQRESFPTSVNYNPLLNCQEYPILQNVGYTELVLPKASLVDIVFVASNFVSESGDVAVLDNIEVIYDSDPAECGSLAVGGPAVNNAAAIGTAGQNVGTAKSGAGGFERSSFRTSPSAEIFGTSSAGGLEKVDGSSTRSSGGGGLLGFGSGNDDEAASGGSNANSLGNTLETISGSSGVDSGIEHLGFTGGNIESGGPKAFGVSGATSNSSLFSASSASSSSSLSSSSSSESKVVAAIRACQASKCTFEDGSTCGYYDVYSRYENETAIHALTNRFQVVQGQFMNRVTGVREGIEGNYYVATFLYPRERAALEANVGPIVADYRTRFQYYEGTHGVQLKGCCDTDEHCPFGTDKFVSVTDRMWKYGSFVCPAGTQKLIFVCENTRTNQGACALDDVQVIENVEIVAVKLQQPLC